MRFESYGIHTRLHYLIKRAGGIDKKLRREWLKNKYGFDDETVDLVLMYNIEKLLEENTIEEIKQLIIEKNAREKQRRENAVRTLSNMLNALCCNSDMLYLGNYFHL